MPEVAAPALGNKENRVSVDVEVLANPTGVIYALGGFSGGLTLYVKDYCIDVNSIAPGALNTRLLDEVLAAGPEKVGKDYYDRALVWKQNGGVPLGKGADLAVFLASDAARGITGRLISAVWDKWDEWPEHLDKLSGSDLYTLRRITGRDRGQSWGDR
jgi:3-oxoacyl-[acyl-carrier protein] reductase